MAKKKTSKKKAGKRTVPNKKQTQELQEEMSAIVECIAYMCSLDRSQQARAILYLAHYFNVPAGLS